MFMINDYHMALINDNDFGLEGNTHVQVYVQLITYMTAHVQHSIGHSARNPLTEMHMRWALAFWILLHWILLHRMSGTPVSNTVPL